MIVNEISLKNFFHYTNNVYEIGEKFNSLERKNEKSKTKASTGAKMMMTSMICHHSSINELNQTFYGRSTSFKYLFKKGEYTPKMHGLRDCIIDTDYKQIEQINKSVIQTVKKNKLFDKNKVDGLRIIAWDGVELTETKKDIKNLPEREHKDGETKKYLKYLCVMNVGEQANIMIGAKQLLEKEKILTESGKMRAKTIGETTAMLEMWPEIEKEVGGSIDVHVMDALFLTPKVLNAINEKNQYFVVRMEDKTKHLYQDAKGIFENSKPQEEYEIIEIITEKTVKYSKKAKHKDYKKSKVKRETRNISGKEIGKKELIEERKIEKKNSVQYIKKYERVIKQVKGWSDEFEMTNYKGKIRVIRVLEKNKNDAEEYNQEIYVATNMLDHPIKTVIKIMHLRWNIENCGFRKLKQQYNIEHIYIGDFNAINYIFQMILLVFNLKELYTKIRLKNVIDISYKQLKKVFEKQFHEIKGIGNMLMGVT